MESLLLAGANPDTQEKVRAEAIVDCVKERPCAGLCVSEQQFVPHQILCGDKRR